MVDRAKAPERKGIKRAAEKGGAFKCPGATRNIDDCRDTAHHSAQNAEAENKEAAA